MNFQPVAHDVIQLAGGVDQMTPTNLLAPGVVRDAMNYEASINGGYTSIEGYERYDGRPSPSDAVITYIFVNAMAISVAEGDTITGTAATGIACDVSTIYNRIAVTKVTGGTFGIGETIQANAVTVGTSIQGISPSDVEATANIKSKAANIYRADIGKVGGAGCEGAALGYALFNNIVYAFRKETTSGTVKLYKTTASGWVVVPFYRELYFTATGAAPAVGSTVTQGAASGIIKAVVLQTGAWGAAMTGKLIVDVTAGTFAAGVTTIPAGANQLTLTGADTAITFTQGGKFEFAYGNFYGSTATNRVYGCDGVNRAFEFNGTVVVPIDTFNPINLTLDKPKHIAIHKDRLFLAISSSIIYSVAGEPYQYDATLFAGEIATGQIITGIRVLPGASNTAALLIASRDNTYILYGTGAVTASVADFNFVSYNTGSGAIDYTMQNMMDTYLMDDKGVVALKASLNYGNFDQATLTYKINKLIRDNRSSVSCSTIDRRKSQYRLFFTTGYGVYITSVMGEVIGCMPVYFPHIVYMADEGKMNDGSEASFFCSTDGYLYQFNKGTSFDGQDILGYFTLKYHQSTSSRIRKRYRKAAVEVSGESYFRIIFGYNLGYGSADISQNFDTPYRNLINSPQWDTFTWDDFIWDGQTLLPDECEMTGTAENVAITIKSNSAISMPHTINSIYLHYSQRRAMR